MDTLTTIFLIVRMMVNCAYPVALVFAMTRFRCKKKTAWLFYGLIFFLAVTANCIFLFTMGQENMMRVFALVTCLPCAAFLFFASKDRLSQIFFSFFTAINALYLTSILSRICMGMREDLIWLDALLRALIFSAILLVFDRKLNRAYHFLADNMKKGWRVIAIIPIAFFGLVMFMGLYPHVRTDNFPAVLILYAILCVVYYIIYMVFRNTHDLILQRQDYQLLLTQVTALQNQTDTIRRGEEQIHLFRHDMRHFIHSLSVFLESGEADQALQLIRQWEESVDKGTQVKRYCENPTINAVLCFYLEKAEKDGICVTTKCDIPTLLPVDSLELSTVFANAIENACNACRKLPEGSGRWLKIRCISQPQLAFEISNTFDGTVEFDPSGIPVSQEKGHGIGTRSIAAFAQKHGAFLDYQAGGGVFRLRLLLNSPPPAAS